MKANISLTDVISRALPELITRSLDKAFARSNNNETTVRSAFTIEEAMLPKKFVPESDTRVLQIKFDRERERERKKQHDGCLSYSLSRREESWKNKLSACVSAGSKEHVL